MVITSQLLFMRNTRISIAFALLCVVFCCFLSIQQTQATKQFTLYRAIQYDRLGHAFGTRRTTFPNALPITTSLPTVHSEDDGNDKKKKKNSQVARSVLVANLDQLVSFSESGTTTTTTTANNTMTLLLDQMLLKNQQIVAVVVVIPSSASKQHQSSSLLKKLERYLLTKTIEKPIYFTFVSSELDKVLNSVGPMGQIVNNDATSNLLSSLVGPDQYQVSVVEKEASVISGIKIVNLVSSLSGKTSSANKLSKPTIAVVANYDTIAAVPEMTKGVASTGSSVVGLLEISRIFKNLYASASTRGQYDMLFVLTGAGRLGYEGARQWLKNLKPSVRNSLQFVLCLENIAGSNLNIHIPQKTNDESIVRLFKGLAQHAKDMNIPLQFSEKLPASGKEAVWEHEIFYRKKIYAATISSAAKSEPQFLRTSTIDLELNQTVLEHNIKLIADALVGYVYHGSEQSNDVTTRVRISDYFVKTSLEAISQHSRYLPFTTSSSPAVDALKTALKQTAIGGKIQEEEFELSDRVYKFYGTPKLSLDVYQVKPFMFDLLIAVPVVGYLAVLWLGLQSYRNKASSKEE